MALYYRIIHTECQQLPSGSGSGVVLAAGHCWGLEGGVPNCSRTAREILGLGQGFCTLCESAGRFLLAKGDLGLLWLWWPGQGAALSIQTPDPPWKHPRPWGSFHQTLWLRLFV